MLQPIHYSLVLNLLALGIGGALAWFLKEPLLFVISLMLCTHALQRFEREDDDNETDPPAGGDYDGGSGGFVRS